MIEPIGVSDSDVLAGFLLAAAGAEDLGDTHCCRRRRWLGEVLGRVDTIATVNGGWWW